MELIKKLVDENAPHDELQNEKLLADWTLVQLGQIGKFRKGRGIKKNDVESTGLPCVRYGELYTNHSEYIKNFHSFISESVAETSERIFPGDILFAGSGETKEEIGKCAAYLKTDEAYAGGDIIIFSPRSTDSLYLGFLLNSYQLTRQKAQLAQGDAVVHIYSKDLSRLKIFLPNDRKEQTAIATALSDADALINSLEQLIEKKKKIRDGMTQELLTPGVHWSNDLTKNLASIGTGDKNTQDRIDYGTFPFFVRSGIIERINSYSFDGEAILVGGDGVGVGKVIHYFNGKFDFHQRVYKISEFNDIIDGYFFYLFFRRNFLARVKQMTAKSSVDSVRLEMIAEMPIYFPHITQQKQIGKVLIDAESEIHCLQKQLAKCINVKQAMMQQLLTGQIRITI